eukprot:TRINITY_DN1046_c0_g1_i2.p1 TRINITY_DN1046_c0_g1~~TRINITY_DN1046_c0_g1_i2.p1  ORF type:complete len:314 (-),score=45.07 TRINITY_DN1046_c0_g1_i2:114-1055(-)
MKSLNATEYTPSEQVVIEQEQSGDADSTHSACVSAESTDSDTAPAASGRRRNTSRNKRKRVSEDEYSLGEDDEPTESINPKRAKHSNETEMMDEESDQGSITSSEPPEEVYVSDSLAEASKSRWGIFTFHYKAKCFASCMPVPIELVFDRNMRPCRFCVPDWQKHPLYLKHVARKNAARQRSISRRHAPTRKSAAAATATASNLGEEVTVNEESEVFKGFEQELDEDTDQTLAESSSSWSSSEGDLSEPTETSSEITGAVDLPSDSFQCYHNRLPFPVPLSQAIPWASLPPNAIFDPFMMEACGWIGRVEDIL